jgi:hypothetical protein
VEADVFRPQSVGRAVRTAFVLGVFLVIALVAAFEAVHQFSALVGNNSKDELSRYLDDNQHTTASPGGAGFKVDFPVPASRESEQFLIGSLTIPVPRDNALVDGEVSFDAIWLTLPGNAPANQARYLATLVNLQIRQLGGTKIGTVATRKVDGALARDVAFVVVDRAGVKHYYDERILLKGRKIWVLRVSSRIRRDAAFQRFAHSFVFTS